MYVVAPEAVNVAELPEQIVAVEVVTETVGVGFTVIVRVAVPVQPLAAVPVTVYVVVEAGDTVTGEPVSEPGIQLYVDAPPPVSVVEPPEQIVVVPEVAVTVGFAFTVITIVCVPVPLALVAVCVTVYVPAVFQTTLATFCVVADAGVPLGNVQVHEVGLLFELSVKLIGVPAQMVVALAVNAPFGIAATVAVMLTLSIYRQLP